MISSLGRDAVMIRDQAAFQGMQRLVEDGVPDDRDVLGNQVLTDTGTHLGKVVDVIIEVGPTADIVGYEVAAAEALATRGERVLIPLPDTIAVSGEHLIVPAAATTHWVPMRSRSATLRASGERERNRGACCLQGAAGHRQAGSQRVGDGSRHG
jgi:uncharacterized protein YrrD